MQGTSQKDANLSSVCHSHIREQALQGLKKKKNPL